MNFKHWTITDGQITSEGDDTVGEFKITGNFTEGNKFKFEKRYEGSHSIYYSGETNIAQTVFKGCWKFKENDSSEGGKFEVSIKQD